jgi:hypothetical protein
VILRHPLIGGGCRRRLTDLGQVLPLSAYWGVALDPVHRVWIAQYDGTLYHGTYDRDGMCTQLGSVSGVASASGRAATQVAVDPALCAWWCATQYGDRLYYGAYDPATGEPTIAGYIASGLADSHTNGLVIDPDARLWIAGGDDGAYAVAYGTYDATGVPTSSGTQAVTASASTAMMIDHGRRLLHIYGAPHVYAYGSSGVLTGTTLTYADVFSGVVDHGRSLAVAANADRSAYVLCDIAADGSLTVLDAVDIASPTYPLGIDPDLGLVVDGIGHMWSYCK